MSGLRFWLMPVLRIGLGGLFIAASVHKLMDPAVFAESISYYQILPDALVNIAAVYLPPFELLCGLVLVCWPRYRASAAFWILLMLLVFTAAIGLAVYRGIDISCGCFSSGASSTKVGWGKLAQNGGLILAALIVWVNALRARAS